MLDEMAIRKKIEWTGHKFSGYIDFGADINNDSLPKAKEAVVFMVSLCEWMLETSCCIFFN